MFYANKLQFVMMLGLTNDGHCLIYNLLVEKHWGYERLTKIFSNK